MRRWLFLSLFLGACGSEQALEYDLEPIALSRAPIQPGGAKLGGLLARVTTSVGLRPLLVDTAFPYNSLARGDCPSSTPGWTYSGRMDVHDGFNPGAALRADFTNVGLFDICPGASGDPAVQPFGVLGGVLLSNFSVEFAFPRNESDPAPASMRLWPGFPGSDNQLAQGGNVVLRFDLRGGFAVAQGNGESVLGLPNSRVVLAACAGQRAFSTTLPAETCARGETGVRASGASLMLAIGTGEGPTILSQSAWTRVAAGLGLAADAGVAGDLYTPFSAQATPARFVALPNLAVFQGVTDSNWLGPCAELAQARRIEWVLANQESGACFQPCDTNGNQSVATHSYLEVGGALLTAVVPDTSAVILSLNADVAAKPRIDGIIGAATLAGTRLRIDYQAKPQGRVIASCLDGETRDTCFVAPSCPGLSQGQEHICLGHTKKKGLAPVCPQL